MLTHLLDKDDLRSLLSHLALSDAGTLGAGSLRNARQWAIASGLVDEQGLTTTGKLVAIKDPYLETTVTDWLIHFYLSTGSNSLWKYFIDTFLPDHSSFAESELLQHVQEKFAAESPGKLKKSVRLILRTYTEPRAIAGSKFLSQEKKIYSTGNPDLTNSYTVGYLLAKLWERDFGNQSAVLVDQIVDAASGLQSVLGISKEQLRQQLDNLAKHKIIEQRSAKPSLSGTKPPIKREDELSYQVHRCWETSIELLEQAYENDIATPNRPLIQSLGDLSDVELPDFSQFLEWSSELIALEGGSKMMLNLAS